MQFHDKDLVKQTQAINTSLMALKDCIRNRALIAMDPKKKLHIPYRNSCLTLLLKDSFELQSTKQCKTVIIANVSPSVTDIQMTKNTLRFIVPIKVGGSLKRSVEHLLPNENSPITWDNKMLRDWVTKFSKGKVNVDEFCPFESGKQILAIPEQQFLQRLMNQGFTEKQSQKCYTKIWSMMIDARTKAKYTV
jgi:kinesin family protein 2/24